MLTGPFNPKYGSGPYWGCGDFHCAATSAVVRFCMCCQGCCERLASAPSKKNALARTAKKFLRISTPLPDYMVRSTKRAQRYNTRDRSGANFLSVKFVKANGRVKLFVHAGIPCVGRRFLESSVAAQEDEIHRACGAVALLGDD